MCSAERRLAGDDDLNGLLLVDDDPLISESLEFVLSQDFDVSAVSSRRGATEVLRAKGEGINLALVDLGLPPEPHLPDEGFALINELLALNPGMKILVLSGQSEKRNVQHALSIGAVDFIPKPCDPTLLKARLHHQLMILDAEQAQDHCATPGEGLLGQSKAIEQLRSDIQRFSDTPFPILIQGESGTGKEVVAHLLHTCGGRVEQPFLSVNCAAFTADLLEAQLFGHARGAFTGANTARSGFFEDAGDGTLFLDEIGEFPLGLQSKLLRVLENGEYYRVGETKPRLARARVVAASNRNLMEEIRAGRFRHDLYHRLGVLTVEVPPLRVRGDDRLLLLDHFQATYAQTMTPFTLDEGARQRWVSYTFPGNVRELRNIVIRLGAKFPGRRVGLTELEQELDSQSEIDDRTIAQIGDGGFRLDEILNDWEQRYIDAALKLSEGNLSEAARLLGVNRTTLYGKIQRLSNGKNGDV